jgi:hypothetical protein
MIPSNATPSEKFSPIVNHKTFEEVSRHHFPIVRRGGANYQNGGVHEENKYVIINLYSSLIKTRNIVSYAQFRLVYEHIILPGRIFLREIYYKITSGNGLSSINRGSDNENYMMLNIKSFHIVTPLVEMLKINRQPYMSHSLHMDGLTKIIHTEKISRLTMMIKTDDDPRFDSPYKLNNYLQLPPEQPPALPTVQPGNTGSLHGRGRDIQYYKFKLLNL